METRSIIALFDIDGTLTSPRGCISPKMEDILKTLQKKIVIGTIGGSDLIKQKEQLGDDILDWIDFSFSENGLIAYHNNIRIHEKSIFDHLGNERYKQFINYVLRYIADLDIPIKRGTFVECRTGMINISPIGRNCSQIERVEFEFYDKQMGIREKMIDDLRNRFCDYDLTYSIGGQISFDVFPTGWDKTYCLQHLKDYKFQQIHFFGDKTEKGGNDYEIYTSDQVIGHRVTSPDDTMDQIYNLWLKQ